LEPGRAGRAWQPPTAFEAQAQEPLRRFDAGGKLVLRAEHPSPDSRPVETAHRPAASLKPPATTAMPGLTDNLEQAFAPAGGLAGHEAKEPPSPTAAPLLPASEDKQNLPDSQAELWREINAWVSAQPAPAVAVDAQQAEPRRSEASRPLETAQDFSLSIGNISIIVEEPPRPPAAPLPPLAKGPSASAGGEGFFRLDRHYL